MSSRTAQLVHAFACVVTFLALSGVCVIVALFHVCRFLYVLGCLVRYVLERPHVAAQIEPQARPEVAALATPDPWADAVALPVRLESAPTIKVLTPAPTVEPKLLAPALEFYPDLNTRYDELRASRAFDRKLAAIRAFQRYMQPRRVRVVRPATPKPVQVDARAWALAMTDIKSKLLTKKHQPRAKYRHLFA